MLVVIDELPAASLADVVLLTVVGVAVLFIFELQQLRQIRIISLKFSLSKFSDSVPVAASFYLSLHVTHRQLFIPNKKPKGGELAEAQKLENQALARERIVVEHAIAGMKRYDILSNVCRLHDWNIYNSILGACAGLWNFSQEFR